MKFSAAVWKQTSANKGPAWTSNKGQTGRELRRKAQARRRSFEFQQTTMVKQTKGFA